MSLPRPGTKIEDLKCQKCQKTLAQLIQEAPTSQTSCNDDGCPQKPDNPPTP